MEKPCRDEAQVRNLAISPSRTVDTTPWTGVAWLFVSQDECATPTAGKTTNDLATPERHNATTIHATEAKLDSTTTTETGRDNATGGTTGGTTA